MRLARDPRGRWCLVRGDVPSNKLIMARLSTARLRAHCAAARKSIPLARLLADSSYQSSLQPRVRSFILLAASIYASSYLASDPPCCAALRLLADSLILYQLLSISEAHQGFSKSALTLRPLKSVRILFCLSERRSVLTGRGGVRYRNLR
jgi:hypothetical protein